MGTSTGRVGAADLVGGVHTAIFTHPSNSEGTLTVTVNIVNRNTSQDAAVRISLLDGAITTIADEDYIEFGIPKVRVIRPGGVIQKAGIKMAYGDVLGAYSDKSNVTVQAWAEKAP